MVDKKSILIIDHDTNNRMIFIRELRTYQIDFLNSLDQLGIFLMNKTYDLIMIGSTLPHKDGLEVLREINVITENSIPIILLIHKGEEKIAVAALNEGVSDYITKDEMIPAILSMAVNRAIEHKKWEKIYQSLSNEEESSYLKDSLTQLYNMCYFKTRLAEEKARSQRYHFPLTMALINIDHFDEINKKFGFETGNCLLKKMGKFLLQNIRSSDLLSRVKDDQFVLLLPHTTAEQAKVVWQRIIEETSQHPFTIKNHNVYITIRTTLILLNDEIESIDKLLQKIETFMKEEENRLSPLMLYTL